MYDVIIIGAGPAGLTAAIYARRANKTALIIEKGAFGGQISYSPRLENYPGFETISGTEFADKLVSHALAFGTEVEIGTVTEIVDGAEFKTVKTEDGGVFQGKTAIIACGAKHRTLGLPNEERFIGEGISFCAVCDGAFYADKEVILVGGGNSALQEAVLLSETCKKVTVVQNLDFLTGEQKLQDILAQKENVQIILGTVVSSILDTPAFTGVTVEKVATGEKSTLKADGMFVAIGLVPENGAFAPLADLDAPGYIVADERCLTKTPGVFVAGDCRTKGVRQVATAIADGATAALAACRFIDNAK